LIITFTFRHGKFAGTFFSTGSLGGGQETTGTGVKADNFQFFDNFCHLGLSCLPFFTHQGMIYVPLGYKNKKLMDVSEVHGGSPWGMYSI
jgi:NAD(P)H dehydrogenase (quinone)